MTPPLPVHASRHRRHPGKGAATASADLLRRGISAVLAFVRGVASGTLAVVGRDVATAAASRNLSSQERRRRRQPDASGEEAETETAPH